MKPLILALVSLQVACVVHESKGTQPLSAEPPLQTDAVTTGSHPKMKPPQGEKEDLLMEALRSLASDESALATLRVLFDFDDLNTDGTDEAIVHVISQDFCGSGGCTTLIYQWDPSASTYSKIHHIPTTRPPIYSSQREGCRWSVLWVQRSGGGQVSDGPSPVLLSEAASCQVPAQWEESKSTLLIPKITAETDGVRP